MKTKKALAVILAVVMTITLIPSMAFATSDSTVKAVPTVAANDEMPEISINIEVKDKEWTTDDVQTVKFTFKNAKWTTNPTEGKIADASTVAGFMEVSNNATLKEIVSVTDESVEFTFVPSSTLAKGQVITVDFPEGALTSGSDDGAVEIAIDGQDSYVSTKTLTVATVGSSNTTASVNGSVKTFGRVSNVAVGTKIEIRETAVNSITTDQVLKLTLPKGVSWDSVTLSGNLAATGNAMRTSVASADAVNGVGDYYLGNDGRSVYIFVDVTDEKATRQVLGITGEITIGKNAAEGDITVDVTSYRAFNSGNSITDASDLVIAKYGEEAVTVTTVDEDDLPTVYAGFVKTNKDKYNWIQLTLKETVKDSLQSGRYIDIKLPEEVQVVNDGTAEIKATLNKDAKLKDAATKYGPLVTKFIDWEDTDNRSEFTITVPNDNDAVGADKWAAAKANTWTLFIPVTVEADFVGDIELTATGAKAGISDTTLTVAKAESPVKVETKSTEVKNGIQNQNLADITITENAVGYMNAGTTLTVALDNLGLKNALVFDDADVKATAGDLEIGKVKIDEGVITIPIKEESTKVSTITISNISATLNRTLPEGKYNLLVGDSVGVAKKSALIDNEAYNDDEFDVTPVTVEGYIDIVTPANTTTAKINAQFVIGQTAYTNNGQSVTMDAAPYIDSHSRTMVPIRYVANACGVSDNNIVWNGVTQTATMSGANTVVTIKVGANTITTSTGTITMDTVAVNKDGRIYVPLRFIANAFGAEVAWNQATMTASIMK